MKAVGFYRLPREFEKTSSQGLWLMRIGCLVAYPSAGNSQLGRL